MSSNKYDAIVIGSGISGGWAAKELTEKGLTTLLLERGRNIEHIKDYKNTGKEAWDFPHRGQRTQQMIRDYPVLNREWLLSEIDLDFWASEKDCPYIEEKPFNWYRGYHVGGRSLMWGRQSYRLSNFDFEANAKEGIAIDWPIRYQDLAPWYSYVERFAGISGSREGLPQLPDGEYLPPMELNCVEKEVAARMASHYNNKRRMIIGRSANVTVAHNGRGPCQFRNKCGHGCPFGAYFSTQSTTLPAAMATGKLTLRPFSIVTRILYDKDSKKATGVEILDAETNKTYTYSAAVIFVCASALNSAWVLMNSATDIWPGGLGSSSGELGHNVMDHHYKLGAYGIAEGHEDKYVAGRRPNGIYIPRYRNLFDDKRDYLRGFGYQGGAGRAGWGRDIAELSIGSELKEALCEPGAWSIGIAAFGEILPYHDNTISLDKDKKDKWGLPVLRMNCVIKENEHRMRKDMMEDAKEMLEIAGIKNVSTFDAGFAMGQCVHEMGTARMGRDPKTSVLNEWNQVWDARNVFVTDGACMTSSACQNPSLTYMAMTARAVDHAVSELKKRNL